MPKAWQVFPAYLAKPGQSLSFNVRRRGDAQPEPERGRPDLRSGACRPGDERAVLGRLAAAMAAGALIIGFVMVMNAYTKPRTDIPRGIPVPVLILIVVVIVMVTHLGASMLISGVLPLVVLLAFIAMKLASCCRPG